MVINELEKMTIAIIEKSVWQPFHSISWFYDVFKVSSYNSQQVGNWQLFLRPDVIFIKRYFD